MNSLKCDIVIPIYNALDCVMECINSVIACTDPELYQLILVNDKSTDCEIEKYLNTVKEFNPNVVLLNNDKNLGFVKSVNKGMSYSNNDVVLLNSDTIVTQGWLSKIKKAAYLNTRIATVTPLTNNGTICSVPNFCEDNTIPEGFDLEEFALLIEKVSLKKYSILPTAVGFCMYIKRKIIDEIGLFDDISFGRGYGEENDFCCRAIEKGYANILCDDTFVYHKGSMSFKQEKDELIKINSAILDKKHPNYFKSVADFYQKNPLKETQEIIKLNIALRNGKRNILYIIHNYSHPINEGIIHPLGGTEYHLKDLIMNLSEFNAYVLVSAGEWLVLQAFIGEKSFYFKFNLMESLDYRSFHLYKYAEILEFIIKGCNIDLIHVQHFLRHTFDIPQVSKYLGIPCVITLHDFYAICPTINLLDIHNVYCHETRNKNMCDQCMKKRINHDGNFLTVWNLKVRSFLEGFEKIYVPSESAKKIIEEYYGNLNIKVIEHGIDATENKGIIKKQNEKFKIAFMGVLVPHKGGEIIEQLIQENKNSDIEWHLFGGGEINPSIAANVVLHGRYNKENIVNTLKELGIDLVCNFAIWPETYSYTLTDAWLAEIPVLAHDIGALRERIEKNQGGWIVPLGSKINEILDKINAIIQNKEDYQIKINNIKHIHFKTKRQMAEEYESDYDILLRKKTKKYVSKSEDFHFIYRGYDPSVINANADNNVNAEENPIALCERLLQFIKKYMPQPLKNMIKKIMNKMF